MILVARALIVLFVCALSGAAANAQTTTVRVGVADIGAPFGFHDEATNSDRGLMVDLIKEMGKAAGLTVQLQSIQFSSLLSAVMTNRVDVAAGTIAIVPANQTQVDFTQKVYTDSDALIVPASDTTKYVTYDDLKGKVLGIQKGVVALPSLHTDLYPTIRVYDGGPDVMAALAAGDVQVAVANRSISGYLLKSGKFPTLQLVTTFKPTNFGDIAFGIRKGNTSMATTLNGALAKVQASGALDTILAAWGVK